MKIGILGGIGVEATGYFYLSLIKRLQTSGLITSNTDYPNFIINSIPAPELHLEEHDKVEILEPYIQGIRDLVQHNPHFIVMVCNTIHLYMDKIKTHTGYSQILSIADIVKSELNIKKPQTICVLGTGLTISRGLYNFPEYSYVVLTHEEQNILCDIVAEFNREGSSSSNLPSLKQKLLRIAELKKSEGAEIFLFACTEISEILSGEPLNSLDTLELLINAVSKRIIENKLQIQPHVSI